MLHSKYCLLYDQEPETLRLMGESPNEQGGYFIINGKEKTVIAQEQTMAINILYLTNYGKSNNKWSHKVDIFSRIENVNTAPKMFSIRMAKERETESALTEFNPLTLYVHVPYIRKEVPLFILLRALGLESDKEIIEHIVYNLNEPVSKKMMDILYYSIVDSSPIFTSQDAFKYLVSLTKGKKTEYLQWVFKYELLPHVGDNYSDKIFFIGHMVNKLLRLYLGLLEPTDKDNFMYKRVNLSGRLMCDLFQDYYSKFQTYSKMKLEDEYAYNTTEYEGTNFFNLIQEDNKSERFPSILITSGFTTSLRGNWGGFPAALDIPVRLKKKAVINENKKGVSQDLQRLTYLGTISQLRRLNLAIDRTTKIVPPRRLHNSQWGVICPVETPEGGNIGLIKSMALLTKITFGSSSIPIIEALYRYGMMHKDDIPLSDIYNSTKIIVNGVWTGIHMNPNDLIKKMRLLRRNGLLDTYMSVSWNIEHKEIIILSDAGRLCRPMYIIDDEGKFLINNLSEELETKAITWDRLIKGDKMEEIDELSKEHFNIPEDLSIINNDEPENTDLYLSYYSSALEYIDIAESNTLLLTSDYQDYGKASHCEIHPSTLLGVLGNCTPFPSHNQSPRNVYSCCQAKQGLGVYTSNFNNRFDTNGYILDYPQKPLIGSRYLKYIDPNVSYGINTIVAIACYTGYNVEDSIIINRSALKRGLFRTTSYYIYQDTKDEQSYYKNPLLNNITNIKKGVSYESLDENGIIKEETKITENAVLIAKYTETEQKNIDGDETFIRDNSITTKPSDKGFVDKVFITPKMAKVRIRKTREPEIGDKFCSRHGQKGVIGMLLNEEDMPFTKDGLKPDIIINPHAIPSRMTIGHLIECLTGKVCSNQGFQADATAFIDTHNPIENIANALQNNCNYERYGNEIMYNGLTGKQLETEVFIGPTYYLRLKHMVQDKVHSRSTGPRTFKTHQPASGRSNDGGLRIGEMERDAILSHGMSSYLKESMYDKSDKYTFNVCNTTGMMSVSNNSENKHFSPAVDGPMEYNISKKDNYTDIKFKWNSNNAYNFSKINAPYAFKLLLQELETMNIVPRLITNNVDEYQTPISIYFEAIQQGITCLLYTSPSPRD